MASTGEVLDHPRGSLVGATQAVAPSHGVPHPDGQPGRVNPLASTGAGGNWSEDLSGAAVQVAVLARGAHPPRSQSARTPDPGVSATTGTRPPPRRWRQRVKSAASAAVAVPALGLFLAWMGGALREKVRPGEVPTA